MTTETCNTRVAMAMMTMTGGGGTLGGCSLECFTEQRMHPISETCSDIMMMTIIDHNLTNLLIFVHYLCLYLYLCLYFNQIRLLKIVEIYVSLQTYPSCQPLFVFVFVFVFIYVFVFLLAQKKIVARSLSFQTCPPCLPS